MATFFRVLGLLFAATAGYWLASGQFVLVVFDVSGVLWCLFWERIYADNTSLPALTR